VIYIDLPADLSLEDDQDRNIARLGDAVAPDAGTPGAVLVAGRARLVLGCRRECRQRVRLFPSDQRPGRRAAIPGQAAFAVSLTGAVTRSALITVESPGTTMSAPFIAGKGSSRLLRIRVIVLLHHVSAPAGRGPDETLVPELMDGLADRDRCQAECAAGRCADQPGRRLRSPSSPQLV
jgi:hypothetical protein